MHVLLFLLQQSFVSATVQYPGEQRPFSLLQAGAELELLRSEVGDRLFQPSPFASACYDDFESAKCADVRDSYLSAGESAGLSTPYEPSSLRLLRERRKPYE